MNSNKVLVTGGAGYIGSHVVKILKDQGHTPVILDNLSSGHEWALQKCEFYNCDVLDKIGLNKIFTKNKFDSVMHFAGKSLVGESIISPNLYYKNNVIGSINLIQECINADIEKFIFSSSAAVYGEPNSELIDENHSVFPKNPYGQSKLMVEKILQDAFTAYGITSISFRYFNAAGADPSGLIGESHEPETHLIPNIINSVLRKNSESKLKIYGNTYPTKDGTCIRDYVHVNDIAIAHLAGIDFLENHSNANIFNLGNGQGYSVFSILDTIKKEFNIKDIPYDILPPREGDSAILVASSKKANSYLDWEPCNSNIKNIIEDAFNWHQFNNSRLISS